MQDDITFFQCELYSRVCARPWESREAAEKEVKGRDVAQWLEGLPGMHEAWVLSLVEKQGEEEGDEEKRGRVGG